MPITFTHKHLLSLVVLNLLSDGANDWATKMVHFGQHLNDIFESSKIWEKCTYFEREHISICHIATNLEVLSLIPSLLPLLLLSWEVYYTVKKINLL